MTLNMSITLSDIPTIWEEGKGIQKYILGVGIAIILIEYIHLHGLFLQGIAATIYIFKAYIFKA